MDWVAACLMLAPAGLLPLFAGMAIGRALLRQDSRRLDRTLAPLSIALLIGAARAFEQPLLWWREGLAWMVALAVASRPQALRSPSGVLPLALVAAALGVAALPDFSLEALDAGWKAQLRCMDLLRSAPILGLGPAWRTSFEGRQLPTLACGLLLEHGWLGYALLCGFLLVRRQSLLREPGLVCLCVCGLLPASSELMLRLSPLLGWALSREAGGGGRSLVRSPRALRWCLAGILLGGGGLQSCANLLSQRADALAEALDWERAGEVYELAARLAPDPAAALYRLMDLRYRQARYRNNEGLEAAEAPALRLIELGFDGAWTLFRLAEVRIFAEPRSALGIYRHALEREPGSPLLLTALGYQYLNQGKFDTAVACFRQAIAREPSLMPRLFHDLRRVSTSGSFLRGLLSPGNLGSHVGLALLFEEAGLIPSALREFEELIRHEDAPAWVHREFAALLARNGRKPLALARLRELSRWSDLGPQERLQILLLLGKLEPQPRDRLACRTQALELLQLEDYSAESLGLLLEGLPARQRSLLLDKARAKLQEMQRWRPSLALEKQKALDLLSIQRFSDIGAGNEI